MIDKALASKMKKAKRYAAEAGRGRFENFRAKFRGDHNTYIVSFDGKDLVCTCPFFKKRQTCSHTLAVREILGEMLKSD